MLPQPPESVLCRTAVGTRPSSRRDLDCCHYLGRPRVATLGLSCTPNRQLGREPKNASFKNVSKPNEVRSRVFLPGLEPGKSPTGQTHGLPNRSWIKDGQRNNGSDLTFSRCSPNRQLAVRDAGGSRTHFDRVAAGCLAVWLQRQASSSGVEPDPRPSQGRMHSATLRGQRGASMRGEGREGGRLFSPSPLILAPRSRVSEGNRTRRLDLHRVACRPLHHRHHQPVVPAGFEPAIFPMSWERPTR